MFRGRLAARNVMRIVTRGTAQLPALQETGRLTQAVSGTGNFELIVMACTGRMVEVKLMPGQRLSGPIGEGILAWAKQRIG